MSPRVVFLIAMAMMLPAIFLFAVGRWAVPLIGDSIRVVQKERLETAKAISKLCTLVGEIYERAERSVSAEVGAVSNMIADIETDRIELPHPGTDSGAAYSTPKAALFDKILKEISDPLYVANRDSFMYVSRSFARLLGCKLVDMVGKNWWGFVHRDDHERLTLDLHEHRGTRQSTEVRFRRRDGGWQHLTLERQIDEEGVIELCFANNFGRIEYAPSAEPARGSAAHV